MTATTQPGDLIFVRGTGKLSHVIRDWQDPYGHRSLFTHVGIATSPRPLHEARILHALSTVREEKLYDRYDSEKAVFGVFRLNDLEWDERRAIVDKARKYIGRKYGPLKLVLHLADYTLGGPYLFRRLAQMDNYPICSWVAAFAYYDAVGYTFGTSPRAASPGTMMNHIIQSQSPGSPRWFTVAYTGKRS